MPKKLFSQDSPFYRFMEALRDLMILNFLWIITCIPVITAGAATTALYAVLFSYADQKEDHIAGSFFKEFIRNIKKATALWMIVLGTGIIMYADLYLMSAMHDRLNGVLAGATTGILTLVMLADLLLLLYVFPMQARYENTVAGTLCKSVIFCFGYFGSTFQMIGYVLLPLGSMMMLGLITGRGLSWAFLFYLLGGASATVLFLVKGPWKRLIKKIEPEIGDENSFITKQENETDVHRKNV